MKKGGRLVENVKVMINFHEKQQEKLLPYQKVELYRVHNGIENQ